MLTTCEALAENLGLKVPEGFEVSRFADDSLAHDIFSLTFDAHGRVVVAGPGYVKRLHDDQHVGRANRSTMLSKVPLGGAQGLCFDGDDLICVGDDNLMRLHIENDTVVNPEAAPAKAQLHEHGYHSIKQGPDGWWYYIIGNDPGGVKKNVTLASSPVLDPKMGAIVRLSPDLRQSEVVADGFRNCYDFDFTPTGQLLTVDSDNERDHHLPWYAPTRLFDVAQGRSHGWLQSGLQFTWNRPGCFFDSVPRMWEIGRGSPTGGVTYRHRAFPLHYREGFFSACWSLGKIYFFPLTREGSSYRTNLEVFLEATGASGFAPTGMAVSPEGDLYVAIGGRQTQGGVFKIHYRGEAPQAISGDPLHQVLVADQPLASWSRAQWTPLAQKLGAQAFATAAADEKLSAAERIRAIEVLVEQFGGVPPAIVEALMKATDGAVAARTAWALSRAGAALEPLARLTHADDLRVQRAAWEALATSRQLRDDAASQRQMRQQCNFAAAFAIADERIRTVAIEVAKRCGLDAAEALSKSDNSPDERWRLLAAALRIDTTSDAAWRALEPKQFTQISSAATKLEILRAIQLRFGDVRFNGAKPAVLNGYSAQNTSLPQSKVVDRAAIVAALTGALPSGDDDLDRELARTLALLEADDPRLPSRLAQKWTEQSSPVDDIHYLICLANLNPSADLSTSVSPPNSRAEELRKQTAHALANLARKMTAREMYPSRNWPERVGEIFVELNRRDPSLARALANDPQFGLPDHCLFVKRMSAVDAKYAAGSLFRALTTAKEEIPWTTELIETLAVLPRDQLLPVLRENWSQVGIRDAIAGVLARQPEDEDRSRFRQTLASVQASSVSTAAKALQQLAAPGSPAEIRTALQALRQFGNEPAHSGVRQDLAQLLVRWTGQAIHIVEPEEKNSNQETKTTKGKSGDAKKGQLPDEKTPSPLILYQPWFDWFAKSHPDEAKKLGSGNVDIAAWFTRLDAVNWESGDKRRGQAVFERQACHRCHTGASKLGPDLAGAAARFSRRDLFEAILDPSKDIAPPYRTTSITTRDGQTYIGIIVYESPDATMLQTGPDVVVRLSGVDSQSMRPSRQSLMPNGLLNEASDQDLADLLVFLKSLTK